MERGLDVCEVHHPAELWIHGSVDIDDHSERVPVETRTFVPVRNVGKPVSGFERELLENLHGHESLMAVFPVSCESADSMATGAPLNSTENGKI